jgi:hypothetical protein
LLHTDFAPDNILFHGGRVRSIGWAWPTRGAAWIGPFMCTLRIMGAGSEAVHAVSWVQCVQSWCEADPKALGAFATAVTPLWREIAAEDSVPWKVATAGHAAELKALLLMPPCVP